MGTPLVATRSWSLKPLGALRLWTIIGLVGIISALIYIQVTSFGFDPLVSGFVLLALIIAAGVVVGWRWAPLLGALWSILLLAAFGPFMIYDLTHPAVFDHFALAVPVVAFLLATVVAGIGATVQHERSRLRPDTTTEPPGPALVAGVPGSTDRPQSGGAARRFHGGGHERRRGQRRGAGQAPRARDRERAV